MFASGRPRAVPPADPPSPGTAHKLILRTYFPGDTMARKSRRFAPLLLCIVAVGASAALAAEADPGTSNGQWRYYGGDAGSTKYSPLDQINAENVGKLKVAWSWDSPDLPLQKENRALGSFAYEATPLAVDGTLYTSTSLAQVAAINGKTGEAIWVFNPEVYKAGRPDEPGLRPSRPGLLDRRPPRAALHRRRTTPTCTPSTPRPANRSASFGDDGQGQSGQGHSAGRQRPQLHDDLAAGDLSRRGDGRVSSISDGPQYKEAPRGDVQAFDVRTGKPAWIFHAIPQEGEFGNDTWEDDSWKYTGNANVWTLDERRRRAGLRLSAHEHADQRLVRRPSAGQRPVRRVAGLRRTPRPASASGTIQTVHHGLWDYDLPGAPVLCDIKVDGQPIKAVAQITKTGFTFVFDRATGKPVWPIEERPVPQSTVPGERTSPTQPFPTKPAPYERQGSTEENLVDFTPEMLAEAKEILNEYDHGPLFTPPTERGTINLPGWAGGANWWGAAFDPDTGMFYIPSITAPIVVKLNKPDAARSNLDYVRGGPAFGGGARWPAGACRCSSLRTAASRPSI